MNWNNGDVMEMAANAALSRRQGSMQRRRAYGRNTTVDKDLLVERQWQIPMLEKATQTDSSRKLEEMECTKKKTLLQGLLILALLVLNISNLKILMEVETPPRFYNLIMTLSAVSLLFQAIIGGLVLLIAFMERRQDDTPVIQAVNNVAIYFSFLVLLLCVFLCSIESDFKMPSKEPESNIVIQ